MCRLCHAPECESNFEKGLHYPNRDHSNLYIHTLPGADQVPEAEEDMHINLFPGQCGASVIWGFFGVGSHNVNEKIEELKALEKEAKVNRHHNLLMATCNTGSATDKMFAACEWKKVHNFPSKYGNAGRELDLWIKDI